MHHQVWHSGEDVQILENALRDSALADETRGAMLKRASVSLLGLGGAGVLLAACGSSSKKKSATTSTTTIQAP
jgi:hypothetical protein